MKAVLSFALISALALTSSATTINKPRQAPGSSTPFTIHTVTSDGVSHDLTPVNGVVFESFYPTTGPFLAHAEIDNDPTSAATCVARDQWGNQVRAFGGPNFGGVESVDFDQGTGKQIFSLTCNLA